MHATWPYSFFSEEKAVFTHEVPLGLLLPKEVFQSPSHPAQEACADHTAQAVLQMGTDAAKLEEGLEYVRRLQADASSRGGSDGGGRRTPAQQEPLQILGSVFIPSKR